MADEDIEDLADDFEEAGTAARMFQDSLAGLPAALGNAQAAAAKAGTATRDAQGRFIAAGAGAQQAGGSMGGLAGAIASIGTAAVALASGPLPSATQTGQALGQALGGALTSATDAAAGALSKLGPEGEAAGAALQALSAVVAATIGTMVTLMGLAIDVTQRVDLMADRFKALAGSASGGAAVTAMVERLSASLPFATAEIQGWAQSLLAAGLTGQRLEASIKAVAAASALMGDQGGAAAENLIKKLAEGGQGATALMKQIQEGGGKSNKLLGDMGLSTHDLAAAMGMTDAAFAKSTLSADQMNDAITKALAKKGAGPLDDLGNTLPNIFQKAREGFLSLFSGLGPAVKPLMATIKSLFGEFDKGSGAISALKPIVTSVFSTLFSWATTAVHAIHAGFLLITIAALKVYIAIKPIIDKIKEFAKSAAIMTALKIAAIALAVPFVIIAAVIGVVVVIAAALVAAFVAIVAGIAYVVGGILNFVSGAAEALASWVAGAAGAAADFVAGLVQGIAAGAGAVISAVKGLASGALSAFTGALGIHSPSRVMLEHGEKNIAGAAATGIDKGTSKVDDAMARMGSSEPGNRGKKGSSSSGSSGAVHYHYSGPVEHYPTFVENMRRFLEQADAEAPPT